MTGCMGVGRREVITLWCALIEQTFRVLIPHSTISELLPFMKKVCLRESAVLNEQR